MCGFCGYVDPSTQSGNEVLTSTVSRMADTLYHRGPDAGGAWVDQRYGVALGHRRLSVLDLSPEGNQPMVSHCGRFYIVFNGEIYNYRSIRQKLERAVDIPWRGHSDTEVLLAAISHWGLSKALQCANGMFAFALWDRDKSILSLGRDRLGEKPLYYGWSGGHFLFGSELKALRAHPAWQGEIDRDALTLLLRYNRIPAPFSVYRGIKKLQPGNLLHLQVGALEQGFCGQIEQYWSALEAAETGQREPFRGSQNEAIKSLDELLSDAVGLRMIADVPVGAFLSGGIDSSTIVALMQKQSSRPVKTFSIGFEIDGYNEAEHAKRVAQHLKTDHTELYVTPNHAMGVIPGLSSLYDEPFSDVSQIPTFLVSQLARQQVTVALSGDGGDELFAGYNRYIYGEAIWKKMRWLPIRGRKLLAAGISRTPPRVWQVLSCLSNPLIPMPSLLGDKASSLAQILSVDSPEALYHRLVSHWKEPEAVVLNAVEPSMMGLGALKNYGQLDCFAARMMYLDSVSYLPDNILTKVDRASMGCSLEARVPMLDHRLFEFAWQIPMSLKIRNRTGKWILRELLQYYVPRELTERPKMGFAVPIDSWLRGPLRDWAETLLAEDRLKRENFFRPQPIRQKWAEHLSGQRNWQYYLWDILMFQAWLEEQ